MPMTLSGEESIKKGPKSSLYLAFTTLKVDEIISNDQTYLHFIKIPLSVICLSLFLYSYEFLVL